MEGPSGCKSDTHETMMLLCRNPDEMRMKLSVQFQGEEGIDAGGVSREWYQVNFAHSLPNMFLTLMGPGFSPASSVAHFAA